MRALVPPMSPVKKVNEGEAALASLAWTFVFVPRVEGRDAEHAGDVGMGLAAPSAAAAFLIMKLGFRV